MTGFTIASNPATTAITDDGRIVVERVLLGDIYALVDGRDVDNIYGDWQYRDMTRGLNGVSIGPVAADDVTTLRAIVKAIFAYDNERTERQRRAEWERLDARDAAMEGIEQVRGGAYDPNAR